MCKGSLFISPYSISGTFLKSVPSLSVTIYEGHQNHHFSESNIVFKFVNPPKSYGFGRSPNLSFSLITPFIIYSCVTFLDAEYKLPIASPNILSAKKNAINVKNNQIVTTPSDIGSTFSLFKS